MNRERALWSVCVFVQSRERECVIVQILSVSSSSQTGDPGLETSYLRLLSEEEKDNKVQDFHYVTLIK